MSGNNWYSQKERITDAARTLVHNAYIFHPAFALWVRMIYPLIIIMYSTRMVLRAFKKWFIITVTRHLVNAHDASSHSQSTFYL